MSKTETIEKLRRQIRDIEMSPNQMFDNSKGFLDESQVRRAARRLVEEKPNNQSFARAVKRAVLFLEQSPFWSFDGKYLHIVSPQSGVEYRGITSERCVCQSWISNKGFCYHRTICLILENLEKN